MKIKVDQLKPALQALVDDLSPGAHIVALEPLSEKRPEESEGTAKYLGYGESLLVTLQTEQGEQRRMVFRTSRRMALDMIGGPTVREMHCWPSILSGASPSTCPR